MGKVEFADTHYFDNIGEILENMEGVKMKIAVASDNGMVTAHFGHCEGFEIFEIKDNKILKNETIGNPGHRPGFLPNFFK